MRSDKQPGSEAWKASPSVVPLSTTVMQPRVPGSTRVALGDQRFGGADAACQPLEGMMGREGG